MKKIVVTGPTGFIGKRLVAQLVSEYPAEQVLCLVHDTDVPMERRAVDYLDSLGVQNNRVELVTASGLEKLPDDIRVVFHLAASTHTEEQDHRCNDVGTANLLRFLQSASPPLHIIFTSTMAVYDDREDSNQPIDETKPDRVNPRSEYGRSKLRAEDLLKRTCQAKGFALTILRLATVYGHGVRENGMFDTLVKMMRKGSVIPRLNWPGKIAMVHVDDCVEAMCSLSKQPPSPGASETYILCSENITLSGIAEQIYRANGKSYDRINLPKFFWRLLAGLTINKKYFESLLPHSIYNKLWQLDLVVTGHMYSNGAKICARLPLWGTRKFSASVREVINS